MTDNRSNLCKILGVDYEEEFEFRGSSFKIGLYDGGHIDFQFCDMLYINPEGCKGWFRTTNNFELINMINNPEEIIHHKIFTPQEIEDAKTLHRLWCMTEIFRDEDNYITMTDGCGDTTELVPTAFPSIKPNESYSYEKIIGG